MAPESWSFHDGFLGFSNRVKPSSRHLPMISAVQQCGLLHVLGAVQVYLPRQWSKGCFEDPQKGAGFFPDDQHYSRLCNFDYGHWYSLIKFPTWPTYSLSSFIASRILLLPRMWLQRARWNTWSALVEGDGRHIWSPDEWKHWPFRSNFLTLGFQNLGFLFSF